MDIVPGCLGQHPPYLRGVFKLDAGSGILFLWHILQICLQLLIEVPFNWGYVQDNAQLPISPTFCVVDS